MARSTAFFDDLSWYFDQTDSLRRQLETLNRIPFDTTLWRHQDRFAQSLSDFAGASFIREIDSLSKQWTPELSQTLIETTNLISKLDTSSLAWQQNLRNSFQPLWKQTLRDHILEQAFQFSRLSEDVSYRSETICSQWKGEISRLSTLADHIAGREAETYEPTEDERQIAAAEVESILAADQNWEQRFMASIAAFQETHPVVAWILEKVFLAILIGVITNMASTALGQAANQAKLYEEPLSSAQVVYHIEVNQAVVIIGEVPYYYEAEVKDPASGRVVSGYVSKRSIRFPGENKTAPKQSS